MTIPSSLLIGLVFARMVSLNPTLTPAYGWLGFWLLAWLAPAILVIAATPEFTTQDGPAHHYNAHIASELLSGQNFTFSKIYELRKEPVPNWGGMAVRLVVQSLFPLRLVDRVVAILTMVGFAGSLLVLRIAVAKPNDYSNAMVSGLSCAFLSYNIVWLFGFESFLIGISLGFWILAWWWSQRDQLGFFSSLLIAILLTLTYFCHLVSLGLIATTLFLLCIATPGLNWKRGFWTAISFAPLPGLAWLYWELTRSAKAPVQPLWEHFDSFGALASWVKQLVWIDPISLMSKTQIPFRDQSAPWAIGFAPALWFALSCLGLLISAFRRQPQSQIQVGWIIVVLLWLIIGLIGPDTLGPSHGHYLPQRIMLFGLAMALAIAPWSLKTIWIHRISAVALGMAWLCQTAVIADYANYCHSRVADFEKIGRQIGQNRRIATLLIETGSPFRSNPLLHADCRLGIGSNNVIWSNYETIHYYFPIQFQSGLSRPSAREFEEIARLDGPDNQAERFRRWETLISQHANSIDSILIWNGGVPTSADLNRQLMTIHEGWLGRLDQAQGRWTTIHSRRKN